MNPNQMMIAKAMVSQEALRDEARRSQAARHRAKTEARRGTKEGRSRTGLRSLFHGMLGPRLAGRR